MTAVHHVNLAIPRGSTEQVVAFYVDVLGLRQLPRPGGMGQRPPGAWLELDGGIQLHLAERDGSPHPDAHLAVVVRDLDRVAEQIAALELPWRETATNESGPGSSRRGFSRDPGGNLLELLSAG